MTKSYLELITIPTFEERLKYLQTNSRIGDDTFGHGRFVNQALYSSKEWKQLRNHIIVRDNGCDLGLEGYEIAGRRILIHHINPITLDDIVNRNECVFNPDNLICVSHMTHNAIHYSSDTEVYQKPVVRSANDTCPWKN